MDFHVERSWATKPLFSRAPWPEGTDGAQPRDFQHAAVEYALARRHCLIGDEPGVGKTLEGILVSNAIRAKRTLVVCPVSLRLNWEREIWRWSTIPNVLTYPISKAADGVSREAHYVILSYTMLTNKNILDGIMGQTWDHVILDEAHAIKSPDAKRTMAVCNPSFLPKVAGRFTLLSGTILPNQPIECYNAARLMDWDCIGRMSEVAFRNHYYGMGGGMVRGKVWDATLEAMVSKVHWSDRVRNVPQNLDELQNRLRGRVMIRRLKEQVHDQLPRKQFHMLPLPLTKEVREALKHPGWGLAERLRDVDPEAFDTSIPVDGQVSEARRLLGEAKAPPACEYAQALLDGGTEKLVVAAWHTSVLKIAKAELERYGLVYMDGSTASAARQSAVDMFQNDPSTRVILGQTAVLGEGWTLTAAQDVLLLEPDWVPGRVQQMVDRIHRMGQKGDYILAHIPVVPGSLDERIVGKAIEKERSIFEALDKKAA